MVGRQRIATTCTAATAVCVCVCVGGEGARVCVHACARVRVCVRASERACVRNVFEIYDNNI